MAAKLELADFAVTQFFFEADQYRGLVDDLDRRGMRKPVVPGLTPVTSLGSVGRMAQMGSPVPAWARERLEAVAAAGGDAAVRSEGVAMATELCQQLLDAGEARPSKRRLVDLGAPASGPSLSERLQFLRDEETL